MGDDSIVEKMRDPTPSKEQESPKIILVILLILLIILGCIEKSGYPLSVAAIVPDPSGFAKTSYGNGIPITGTTVYTFQNATVCWWDESNTSYKMCRNVTSSSWGGFDFFLAPPNDFGSKPGTYTVQIKTVDGNASARWQVTGSLMHLGIEWRNR